MPKLLLATSLLLANHLGLTQAQGNPKFIDGPGQVFVFNGTDVTQPGNYLGCMAEDGAFTLNDCGVFTRSGNGLSTSKGNCTWHDSSKLENTDSIYGRGSFSWSCTKDVPSDLYYSFTLSTPMPIICHSNLDCFIDVKTVPSKVEDRLPLWEFRWGSQEFLPAGHTQGMFMWAPVDEKA